MSWGSESLDMISDELGELFEGDSADTCSGKFSCMLMGAEQRVLHMHTWEWNFLFTELA